MRNDRISSEQLQCPEAQIEDLQLLIHLVPYLATIEVAWPRAPDGVQIRVSSCSIDLDNALVKFVNHTAKISCLLLGILLCAR